MKAPSIFALLTLLLIPSVCPAQIAIPSDGSDGVLNLTGSGTTTIDLSLATTGSWSDPVAPEDAGKGIYDPTVWAVVYKYESVNIGTGRTVNFKNHPMGAPVVWLVNDRVTINGTVSLGATGKIPGPGGFGGGIKGCGLGPGGGGTWTEGSQGGSGSYGTSGWGPAPGPVYGNQKVFPLIGGSGGSAVSGGSRAGGGGAGAILIASRNVLELNGGISATGALGNDTGSFVGTGSGGGVRLVADSVRGTGDIDASAPRLNANQGGMGRIRIEANELQFLSAGTPAASIGPVDDPPLIFPDANTPVIRSIRLGGRDLPADPKTQTYVPDLFYPAAGDYELEIEAFNVPEDAMIEVRVTPATGQVRYSTAAFVSGNIATSMWSAYVTLPDGKSEIQARAIITPTAP